MTTTAGLNLGDLVHEDLNMGDGEYTRRTVEVTTIEDGEVFYRAFPRQVYFVTGVDVLTRKKVKWTKTPYDQMSVTRAVDLPKI
jgi:hypothetical protein